MESFCVNKSHFLYDIPWIVFYSYIYEEAVVKNVRKTYHMEK